MRLLYKFMRNPTDKLPFYRSVIRQNNLCLNLTEVMTVKSPTNLTALAIKNPANSERQNLLRVNMKD